MFYCRLFTTSVDGYRGYFYLDANIASHRNGLQEPATIAEAQSACTLQNSAYTAIDAQIVYSDGITTGIGEFDWQNVYDAFGMSLVMFAVGAGLGIILNTVRKLR